jgi:hypothetical protein
MCQQHANYINPRLKWWHSARIYIGARWLNDIYMKLCFIHFLLNSERFSETVAYFLSTGRVCSNLFSCTPIYDNKLRYVASVGIADNNFNKPRKFYSLPKRYNKLRDVSSNCYRNEHLVKLNSLQFKTDEATDW